MDRTANTALTLFLVLLLTSIYMVGGKTASLEASGGDMTATGSTGPMGEPDKHRIKKCPSTPNCVSSMDESPGRGTAPFRVKGPGPAAWDALKSALMDMPGTSIVQEGPSYLHAEVSSGIFRFIDDLEFEFMSEEGLLIHVRSAARTGIWDFGVNKRRVEKIRAHLKKEGHIH